MSSSTATLFAVAMLLLLVVVHLVSADDCHHTEPKPYIYHGRLTPYELINNDDSSPVFAAGCKPAMFWLAARSGTQYPTARDVARMKDRLPKLRKTILQNSKDRRGRLCQQDVDALNGNGTIRIDDDFDEALTPTGREELLLLARRFRGRFAEFFNEQPAFNPQDYQFRHVKSSAAQASARSFSRGIFSTGKTGDQVQLTEAPIGDRLVHFNHNCSLWKDVVDESEASEREYNLFKQSPIYLKTLADVTARLGFQYNMSIEDMQIMYDICRYQKAWNLEVPSPWCSAFSIENLKVLEYAEDLETYYKQGYGFELNYRQACPLVNDLVTRIRGFKSNGTIDQQRGLFYFIDGDAALRLVARLGLGKDDEPLKHDRSPSLDRKWRTSLLGSFAANIAVVLYDCSGDYKVQLFVKEDVIHLNQCQSKLCTASEFLAFLGPVADKCVKSDGCDPNAAATTRPSFWLLQAILFLVILKTFKH